MSRQAIAERMTAEGGHTGYYGPLEPADVCRTSRGVHIEFADKSVLTITPEGVCASVGQGGFHGTLSIQALYTLRGAIDGLISDATHKALAEMSKYRQENKP